MGRTDIVESPRPTNNSTLQGSSLSGCDNPARAQRADSGRCGSQQNTLIARLGVWPAGFAATAHCPNLEHELASARPTTTILPPLSFHPCPHGRYWQTQDL